VQKVVFYQGKRSFYNKSTLGINDNNNSIIPIIVIQYNRTQNTLKR